MLSNIKWILIGIVGVAIIGFGGNHLWKYHNLVTANEILTEANSTYEYVSKVNNNTIKSLKEDAVFDKETIGTLNSQLDQSRSDSQELSRLLQRHSLEHLATSKPGLITIRMNRATQSLFQDLEDLTNE